MEYFLMRKDDIVTLCQMTEDGQMISWAEHFRNPELAPLEHRASRDYLRHWWNNRQIPIRQGRLEHMLREKNIADPAALLIRNLGLSLTDYYWMKPVNSDLRWADVNLYDNRFRENILRSIEEGWSRSPRSFTPNSSLRGDLEKSWVIRRGHRCLIKGNRGELSSESINEVIASEFHGKQGYDNYTSYQLLHIKDKPYDYGCISQAFTSGSEELLSAYAILTSEEYAPKASKKESEYERFIRIAVSHGMDEEQLRGDLEYQILTDYLLSNPDRHMENLGILRDADTLRWIRMAPIFDTGRALAAGSVVPYAEEEIDNIEVNSFERTETQLLQLVTDRTRVDPNKALSPERVRQLYQKDTRIRPSRIDHVVRLYEKKLERLYG